MFDAMKPKSTIELIGRAATLLKEHVAVIEELKKLSLELRKRRQEIEDLHTRFPATESAQYPKAAGI
jgi:hypothetical protein